MSIAEQKNILRSEYKSKIQKFVNSVDSKSLSEGIQSNLDNLLMSLKGTSSFGVYSPLKDEVDWRPSLSNKNYTLGYPVIDKKSKSMEYFTSKNLESGIGISLSEEKRGERVEPEALLIPGLAFDEQGYRLGRGGGYYDRLLTNFKGVKIGIVYSCSYNGALPRLEHDEPVDYIVTEKALIKVER